MGDRRGRSLTSTSLSTGTSVRRSMVELLLFRNQFEVHEYHLRGSWISINYRTFQLRIFKFISGDLFFLAFDLAFFKLLRKSIWTINWFNLDQFWRWVLSFFRSVNKLLEFIFVSFVVSPYQNPRLSVASKFSQQFHSCPKPPKSWFQSLKDLCITHSIHTSSRFVLPILHIPKKFRILLWRH